MSFTAKQYPDGREVGITDESGRYLLKLSYQGVWCPGAAQKLMDVLNAAEKVADSCMGTEGMDESVEDLRAALAAFKKEGP